MLLTLFVLKVDCSMFKVTIAVTSFNKSSAVIETGDCGHNRHGRKDRGRGSVPVSRRAGTPSSTMWPRPRSFRTKWRLHPSSRLTTINMGQKPGGGGCALCSGGSWVPIEHKVAWAEAYLHTKRHLDASSRLATIKMGRNWGALSHFGGWQLVPHLAQCGLDQGPPPC